MQDKQIVELYWSRNEAAITESQKKYGRYCRYIAYQILHDEEDAKEIENDTYLAAWNTIPPQKPDPLKPYLGTLCRRGALDRYDSSRPRKEAEDNCRWLWRSLSNVSLPRRAKMRSS